MATTGWLGEQTVHQWGGWGTRFTTNVYISGIRRYSDHVDVSGTIYLYCKSNGAYSVWYDWNITSWSMGNNLGQIKERTYTNNILNRSWGKNFTVRINCSNSATSATFNAGFSDSNMGGRDKYWTIYFDRYATAPSGITSTSSYAEYSTITTSCSGIKWGQGYSNRKLTCTASYTFNGKTENFTLGTWTDGATSKTVTKSDFNFPADLNVSIKWVASTNVGSTTSTSQVRVGQTYPAPNLSEVNFEGNSPSTYKLNATVTGINYGENYSKREAKLYFDYTLDGISYSTLLSSISDGSTSITVEYDATTEDEPWKFIPDDEKGILRLVVDNGHRTSAKSSAQIYCQPQYEAYIVESIPESEKEKSEIYTGKNIQIQNAPKNAPLADFKLYGDTFQQSYTGKNLANTTPVSGGSNGVVATYNSQTGEVTVSGKAQTTWSNTFKVAGSIYLTAGTYTLKQYGKLTNGLISCYALGVGHQVNASTLQNTFTTTSDGNAYICITKLTSGKSVSGTIKVQLEAGSSATDFEPFCGGIQSPNPDYPQNIRVVTGENVVKVTGKNILKPSENLNASRQGLTNVVNDDGSITTSGKPTADWNNFIYPNVDITDRLEDGATYTISQRVKTNKLYLQVNARNKNTGASQYIALDKATSKSFTVDKSSYTYTYTIQSPLITTWGDDTLTITNYYQLEKSSQATDFEPYQEQSYKVNLGKNLFDKNAITTGYYVNSSGELVALTGQAISDYIPVEPNTPFTYSGSTNEPNYGAKAAWYTADKTWISSINYGHSGTITSPANAYYFRTSVRVNPGDPNTYQFEKGSTATDYAAFFTPIELCAAKLNNTNYGNYFYRDNNGDWYIHKEIGKQVVDASAITLMSDYTNVEYAQIGKTSDAKSYGVSGVNQGLLCSHAKYKGGIVWDNTDAIGYIFDMAAEYYYWIGFTKGTGLDAIKTALGGCVIYYPLDTPTNTKITNEALIEQLEAIRTASLQNEVNNITNIAISPNLAGDMEISYYTKWQDTIPATLYSNGKNGTGQFKQIRRIGTK